MSIKDRIQALNEQIDLFLKKSGRKRNEVSLVAVSKYAMVEEIQEAYDAGLRHFGESRLQEALPKTEKLPKDISWHFIGSIQSNKVGKIVELFSLIHSVDSKLLAHAISEKSIQDNKISSVLLQINTSEEPTKQGFSKEECMQVFDELRQLKGIHILGLMTMAPLTDDTLRIRRCFSLLHMIREELRHRIKDIAILPHLSMGMSQDYPIAIEEGATLLRIGSALFPKKD